MVVDRNWYEKKAVTEDGHDVSASGSPLWDEARLGWAIKEALSHEVVGHVADAAADMSSMIHLGNNRDIFAYGFAAGYHYFSAQSLGRRGGQAKSKAKAKAARRNGKLGGRPKSSKMSSQSASEGANAQNSC